MRIRSVLAAVLAGSGLVGLLSLLLAPVSRGTDGSLGRAQGWVEQRLAEARSPVPRVAVLDSYRTDWNRGHPWTVADVVSMERARPEAYLLLGFLSGYPPGSPMFTSLGRLVDGWQTALVAKGLDPGHFCTDWRPDVVFKHVDGTRGEKQCGSLLGSPVCAPAPCSAHPDNPCTRWEGDMQADWGAEGRFDPAWLLRVPAKTWDGIAKRYYDGQDFCSGTGHQWGDMTDRASICAANDSTGRIYLYGKADPKRRRLRFVSGVGLDLRIPEAREWNARRMLSMLKDQGIDPGESACVIIGYKPGLWSYYGGRERRRCQAEGVNSWTGYETPENAAACWGGGIFPTPYGPGEFEKALNEQMRTVFRLMDQPAPQSMQKPGVSGASYSRIRFVTTERPDTRGRIWWVWEADVRQSGRLLGEMRNEKTPLARR